MKKRERGKSEEEIFYIYPHLFYFIPFIKQNHSFKKKHDNS